MTFTPRYPERRENSLTRCRAPTLGAANSSTRRPAPHIFFSFLCAATTHQLCCCSAGTTLSGEPRAAGACASALLAQRTYLRHSSFCLPASLRHALNCRGMHVAQKRNRMQQTSPTIPRHISVNSASHHLLAPQLHALRQIQRDFIVRHYKMARTAGIGRRCG